MRVQRSRLIAACAVFLVCVTATTASQGQTFTTLVSFGSTNGANPEAALVQGIDGNFYGTAGLGGANNEGTVFRITPNGTLATLYSFCTQPNCADGAAPTAALTLGNDGNFYGTTVSGGTSNSGTVFKITPTGAINTLYNFCAQAFCTDGRYPAAPLILGSDGNLYGTARFGGNTEDGTVFKITPEGILTVLHQFCPEPDCGLGERPEAALLEASDGSFYGTTTEDDLFGGLRKGTIFKLTAAGRFSTLYRFRCSSTDCTDGEYPRAGLVQGIDGNFYGTTAGASNRSFSDSTVFKLPSVGDLTTLYRFCSQPNCADGTLSEAPLVLATDGNFYGTSSKGGANFFSSPLGQGTIFSITSNGELTTLHSFCFRTRGCDDEGAVPLAGLLQATDGTFYGTTANGGDRSSPCPRAGCGTVFNLDVGLGPFVAFVQPIGKIGRTAQILGQGLTGTTSATFNGVPATTFKVLRDTYMTAVIPAGATTGPVVVTTPSGTLTSNKNFVVR